MQRLLVVVAVLLLAISSASATTTPEFQPVTNFTGYINVNESANSQIFFWLFESLGNPLTDPLILWLQGGPGCSSMIGLFQELGPWRITEDGKTTVYNQYAWNNVGNVLFVDQPVGTGFSYLTDPAGTVTSQEQMAENMMTFLFKWLARYPQYQPREFYITGESYAGKYIPVLATAVLANGTLPLKGVAIGDGWTEPLLQTSVYGDQAEMLGLIDRNERAVVEEMTMECTKLVWNEQWEQAATVCDNVLGYIVNASGQICEDDVRMFKSDLLPTTGQYLNQASVKQSLGVPVTMQWQPCNAVAGAGLHSDEMKPVGYLLPGLLRQIRVLIYNGQFDLNCGVPGTELYLRTMQWDGQMEYLAAPKHFWQVNGKVYGYARTVRNLTQLVVHGAGHMVPMTQPVKALDMITRLVRNQPFF